MNIHR